MISSRGRRWGLLLVLTLTLALSLSPSALAARQAQTPTPGPALLRMVQTSPNTPPSDVFLDDSRISCGLGFAGVTRYEYVGPGTYTLRFEVPAVAATPAATATGAPAATATAAPAPTNTPVPAAPQAAPTAAPTSVAPPAGVTPSAPGGPCCGPPAGVTPHYGEGPGAGPGEGPGMGPRHGSDTQGSAAVPDVGSQAATPGAGQVIASASANLAADTVYSAVLVGMSGSADVIVMQDDLSAPPSGQVKVRFFNASPNAPALDLVESGGPTLFSGTVYKQATDYKTVGPASTNLEVHDAKTGNVVATLPNVTLNDGVVYTVYAIGSQNGQPPLQLRLTVESVSGMPVPTG